MSLGEAVANTGNVNLPVLERVWAHQIVGTLQLSEVPLVEVAALQQLHHPIGRAVFEPADIRHASYVLALGSQRSTRFTLEPRHRFSVAERVR